MIVKILLVVAGTWTALMLAMVRTQQTVTGPYSDAGSYKSSPSGYQSGSSRPQSGYPSGSPTSAAGSYGAYSQSATSGSYRSGSSYSAEKSAPSTYKCTAPYCKANPCFVNSLPYKCTLEQCYEALNAQNDFTIFVPNTITVPKCFFNAPGFKLFSYNLCMKDTVPCTGICQPASATWKKIFCSWNTWRAKCITAENDWTTDGYVYVSKEDGWKCAKFTDEDVTLECQIKAFNGEGDIIGFSNPFKIYIIAQNLDCPWHWTGGGQCDSLRGASATLCQTLARIPEARLVAPVLAPEDAAPSATLFDNSTDLFDSTASDAE